MCCYIFSNKIIIQKENWPKTVLHCQLKIKTTLWRAKYIPSKKKKEKIDKNMIQWICKKYDFYHVRLWKVFSVYNIVSFFFVLCAKGFKTLSEFSSRCEKYWIIWLLLLKSWIMWILNRKSLFFLLFLALVQYKIRW